MRNFVKNLYIHSFNKEQTGTLIGTIKLPKFNHSFELNYQLLDNYALVYAVNKINKFC